MALRQTPNSTRDECLLTVCIKYPVNTFMGHAVASMAASMSWAACRMRGLASAYITYCYIYYYHVNSHSLQVDFTGEGRPIATEGEAMVRQLQAGGQEVDRQLDAAQIRLFQGGAPLSGSGERSTVAKGAAEDDTDEDDDDADGELESHMWLTCRVLPITNDTCI